MHCSRSPTSRVFAVDLRANAYQCFKCRSAGNQLGLYAAVIGKGFYEAVIDLCRRLNREPPWIERW